MKTLQADIRAIKRGDTEAFRLFMDSKVDYLLSLVLRIVPSRDEASDIVQETFIKIWEKRNSISTDGAMEGYMKKIAVNKCYDYLRRKKRVKTSSMNEAGSILSFSLKSSTAADEQIEHEEYEKLLDYLTSKLSPRQRLIFTLSDIEEFSHDDISELTGLAKSVIKSNLYHARNKVRRIAGKIL